MPRSRSRRAGALCAAALAALASWHAPSARAADAYYTGGSGEADYTGGSDAMYHFGVGLGMTDRVNLEIKYVDYGMVDEQGDDGLVFSLVSEWPFNDKKEAALIVELGADSGGDPFFGVGVLFQVSPSIAVTAEYEVHEIDDHEFSTVVVSARLLSF